MAIHGDLLLEAWMDPGKSWYRIMFNVHQFREVSWIWVHHMICVWPFSELWTCWNEMSSCRYLPVVISQFLKSCEVIYILFCINYACSYGLFNGLFMIFEWKIFFIRWFSVLILSQFRQWNKLEFINVGLTWVYQINVHKFDLSLIWIFVNFCLYIQF